MFHGFGEGTSNGPLTVKLWGGRVWWQSAAGGSGQERFPEQRGSMSALVTWLSFSGLQPQM